MSPIRRGVSLAMLAAGLFGLTVPLAQRASAGAGALAAAALLYVGAAVAAAAGLARRGGTGRDAPIRRAQVGLLVVVALVGGLLAPALLVLGLKRTDAASASLLLALEAPFTLLLARVVHGEHLGRRLLAAAGLIVAGALFASRGGAGRLSLEGGLLVAAATLAWALDNIASRHLADRDPLAVVAGKGFLGGSAAAVAALAVAQEWPSPVLAVGLLAVGGLGFGVSLQLYLRAQRIIGAGRTASVFSVAPFVGAAAALAFGTPWPGWQFAAAAVLVAAGLWLHATERHDHRHVHGQLEHEHLHTHDDEHHDHVHDPIPAGPHSHEHRHERLVHNHPHGEDLHHRHAHRP